jgi:hypothetical protein
MPEVFDPPPEVVSGFMAEEIEQALTKWNPLVWGFIKRRGLFITAPHARFAAPPPRRSQGACCGISCRSCAAWCTIASAVGFNSLPNATQ